MVYQSHSKSYWYVTYPKLVIGELNFLGETIYAQWKCFFFIHEVKSTFRFCLFIYLFLSDHVVRFFLVPNSFVKKQSLVKSLSTILRKVNLSNSVFSSVSKDINLQVIYFINICRQLDWRCILSSLEIIVYFTQ